MISAIIVLILLSLLVATEPEQVESSAHSQPEPPLHPKSKSAEGKTTDSDRLAA